MLRRQNKAIPYKMLIQALSSTYELIDRILPEQAIYSLKIGIEYLLSVLQKNLEKIKEGKPIVGYHFAFPAEFLACFDCVPVCLEGIGYFLAALLLHGVEKYYDLMTNFGHPFHTCSAQRGIMGMTLDDLMIFDAIITPTSPCDSTCASYPWFKYHKKFPVIIADMPFQYNEKGYQYYATQIRLTLEKVGRIIGQEPNYQDLKQALSIENEVLKTKLELFDLIKVTPSPIENMFNAVSAGTTIFISGTPENLSFYNKMLDIAKYRYKKTYHHGGEEKIRSIWPYMISFFDISLLEWLDRKMGMSVLFDIFNQNFSDPVNISSGLDTMFYGMAKKAMNWPMVKQSGEFFYSFLDECITFAKEFNADCFIFTQSLACKQFGSVPQLLKEALKEEVGIPMLIINFDVGDARVTSLQKMKESISLFAQTLL